MKYIKKYESKKQNKYHAGDFVIINLKMWKINSAGNLDGKTTVNALVCITHVNKFNANMYAGYYLPKDTNADGEIYFKEEDIAKLVSKEEAEMYINSMKYNI